MICGKKYLLVLVLFFLGLSVLFSDVTLTEQEYQTVMTELADSKTALKNSETQITGLEKELELSSEIIKLQVMESALLRTSLKEQKKDQMIQDLKMFGLGFLGGNVTGLVAGLKI